MITALKYLTILVLGVAYWAFVGAAQRLGDNGSILEFDPGSLAGLGTWMCAVWVGMILANLHLRS